MSVLIMVLIDLKIMENIALNTENNLFRITPVSILT